MPTRGPLDLLTLAPCQHKVLLAFEEALLMYCKLPSKHEILLIALHQQSSRQPHARYKTWLV
jgi:hypothetical protein